MKKAFSYISIFLMILLSVSCSKDSEDKTNTFEYWPSRETFTSYNNDGSSTENEYFVFNNLSITQEQLDSGGRFNVFAAPVNDR